MPSGDSWSTHVEIFALISIFACMVKRIWRRVCTVNTGCGDKWEVLLADTSLKKKTTSTSNLPFWDKTGPTKDPNRYVEVIQEHVIFQALMILDHAVQQMGH